MEHYVMISHFENEQDDQDFRAKAVTNYPRHKIEEHEDITYVGFAAREQAEVEDFLDSILNRFGISDKDFVALYYSRDNETIQRNMVMGPDRLVENLTEKVSQDEHVNRLSRLLNYDYVEAMPNP
ncbi:hypothetical protein [Tunicatimonas pelagia]|uniref:hypothetical protein n=1 Tax=Tunicatimonas pelagia TaxID=931531 RepID=UPI002665E1FF|nr:hypothetical protein [Tunicatimonas pelagia]WKN41496.1 hypothetical protein P0M28_20890 [Tunicatimonas pelagia]